MKTLVTGAAGFIGSAVVRRLLARGRAVRVLLEPGAAPRVDTLAGLKVERMEGSVLDRQAVARAVVGCEAVHHLAAIYALWTRDPRRLYEVNVAGTTTVLSAALRHGVRRVVHVSSIAAVGAAVGEAVGEAVGAGGGLADEDSAFGAADWAAGNDYIRSKWLAERVALDLAEAGLPLVVVNPAFPFGARDVGPTPTGRMILEVLRGRRVPGVAPGGFCVADVDDMAEAAVLAEERGRVGARYILGSHNLDFVTFYRTLCEVAGCPGRVPLRVLPAPLLKGVGWLYERWADWVTGEAPPITRKGAVQVCRRLWFDTRRAREELGMPTTPLAVTLERAVRWFRDHGYAPGP